MKNKQIVFISLLILVLAFIASCGPVDKTAPILKELAAIPSPSTITTPEYKFSSSEAGKIQYGGDCSSPSTTAKAGENTVVFNALSIGKHDNCSIVVTDSSDNSSKPLKLTAFEIIKADTTAPVRSNGLPKGSLNSGTKQVTISLITDEKAKCKYDTVAEIDYESMSGSFNSKDNKSHSKLITSLVDGQSYKFYVRCQDFSNNQNDDDFIISFSISEESDTEAPIISNGSPSGTLAAGSTETDISVDTNEDASCRYSTSANVAYADMSGNFSSSDKRRHVAHISALVSGQSYKYFVRCQDIAGNANSHDYSIVFDVAVAAGKSGPAIFFSDLTSGPKSGGKDNKGVFVTIWGKGFGDSRAGSTVSVGAGLVDNYSEWSDSMVSFQLGSKVSTGDIILRTSKGTSNPIPFTVRQGNIYFISPSGTGNGSFDSPMSPFELANHLKTENGVTAYFRTGVYDKEYFHKGWNTVFMLELAHAGEEGLENAFVAYPGDKPLIKTKAKGTAPDRSGFKSAGGEQLLDYIVISKLSFETRWSAISADSHWRIIGNDIIGLKEATAAGVIGIGRYHVATPAVLPMSEYIYIYGNKIHGSRAHATLAHSIYPGSGTSHLYIGWNHIYDNDYNNGVLISLNHNQAYAKKLRSVDVQIHDNILDTSIFPSRMFGVFEVYDGSEIYYYNNTLIGSAFPGNGNVYAASGNLHYYNNTLINTGSSNLGSSFFFYCNDIYGHHYCPESVELKNNLTYSASEAKYYINVSAPQEIPLTQSNNLWYGIGSYADHNRNGANDNNMIDNQDPLFIDRQNNNFELKANSPAIDKGVTISMLKKDANGILRPQGSAYDIGAFEAIK